MKGDAVAQRPMGGDEVVDATGIGRQSELSEQVVHAVQADIHGNFFSWR